MGHSTRKGGCGEAEASANKWLLVWGTEQDKMLGSAVTEQGREGDGAQSSRGDASLLNALWSQPRVRCTEMLGLSSGASRDDASPFGTHTE